MEAMKCPNCGAGILKDSGQFCSFCGAKLPDNVHRSEIRIENVSELERIQFEREQAERQEQKELAEKKKRRRLNLLKLSIPVAFAIMGLIGQLSGDNWTTMFGYAMAVLIGFMVLFTMFVHLLDHK